ncbi:capsule biosynthesis GfcC family protein [Enterovibrio norvegicus]|uniref:Capsule biosynthesis GfcC n=1 Tax=Enterovibrio norvegicus DSM 15893 TaxID=1121869 RepID=A0A1I5S9J7_9GAMM|nr:capsule biosynthesis GfcC family protein [Enterovibrio norvegicus]SFP66946.1 Capsule biosynthesis GfcC [Enterovibrio norvegicus DSM 15893]
MKSPFLFIQAGQYLKANLLETRRTLMNMTTLFAASVFCLTVSGQANATEHTKVTVTTSADAKHMYHVAFNGAPRVAQVVSQGAAVIRANANNILAHNTDTVYWQGAGLFDTAVTPELASLKKAVTDNLNKLQEAWQDDVEKNASVTALSTFLAEAHFQSRIHVPLDEDFYLSGSKVNPLVQGDLMLVLPTRPNNVWVVGAVTETTDADFHPDYVADDYVDIAETLNTFGISDVTVIQPDGHLETHQTAYWNQIPKNLAPGAMIFVPFQGLPSALSSLNRDIPRLLQHRVM